MSNPSLREQLAALSGEPSTVGPKKEHNKRSDIQKPVRKESKPIQKSAAPAWLEQARYGVELLKVHFPSCFGEREAIRPLKTGIRQDLVKELGAHEDIALGDKACMVSSLAYYVNSVGYHKSVVVDADRVDLTGQAVGKVTAEEAQYSKLRLEAKWQKRQAGTTTPSSPVVRSDTQKETT